MAALEGARGIHVEFALVEVLRGAEDLLFLVVGAHRADAFGGGGVEADEPVFAVSAAKSLVLNIKSGIQIYFRKFNI